MDNGHEFTLTPDVKDPVMGSQPASLGSYKSNYRKGLPAKVDKIEELLANTQNLPDNVRRLYVKFYNLAGTSGTFGADIVSSEAGKLVGLLQPVVDHESDLTPDMIIDLEKGVQSLRKAAIEAASMLVTEKNQSDQAVLRRQAAVTNPASLSEIFLVDGDQDFSSYLQLFLEKLGHRVYPFATPEDLLTVSQGVRPKAIIIDLVFQDGAVEGARIIREVQKHHSPPVPVLFMSFRDDLEARMMAAGAMGTHYFKKPVNEDRLLITLDHIAFSRPEATSRVLVVNSNSARGERQQEQFKGANLDAIFVQDPLHIFKALAHYQPDMLLIETTEVNCFELSKAVKQHEAYATLPIAIVSGVPYETGSLLAAEAGADTLIPVATPPAHLIRIIKAHLERISMLTSTPEARTWSP